MTADELLNYKSIFQLNIETFPGHKHVFDSSSKISPMQYGENLPSGVERINSLFCDCGQVNHYSTRVNNNEKQIRHKVGCTRTIRTAILVVEYLKDKCCHPYSNISRDSVRYVFTEASDKNGWWSADIVVDGPLEYKWSEIFVTTCRAFVAGAGEIW